MPGGKFQRILGENKDNMKRTIYFIALIAALAFTACTNTQDSDDMDWTGTGTFVPAGSDTLYIQGAVGRLHTIVDRPDIIGSSPNKAVMILHGFQGSKDSSLHRMLADTLVHRDYIVVRFDYNGQGLSDGEFKNMTVLNEMEDTRCVYRWLRQNYYIEELTLIGHSLGGVITSMFAAEMGKDSIQNVVMLAPAPSVRNMLISGKFWGAEFDSHNPPAEMAVWNNGILGREFITTLRDMPLYELAKPYNGRVCLIHGDDDWLIPYTDSETYHLIWPQSEFHKLNNCEHLFYGKYHDVTEIIKKFLNN